MRDQDPGLSPKDSSWSDNLLEDVLPDVRVDGRKRIIEQIEVGVVVHSSGQAYPLLLPARYVDPFLSNLSFIAPSQNFQVRTQSTDVNDLME